MFSEYEEIIPKSYPRTLLQKDWNKRKCYWSKPATEFMAKVHDMEVKDDDVWLVTLPKSGTTWMQELLWLVMNDFDFDAAKNEHLEVRSPYLENIKTAFRQIEPLKSPRLIKAHLPLPLLPAQLWQKKPKVVYVFRNPKDSFISIYYHLRNFGYALDQSLEEFMKSYMQKDAYNPSNLENVTEFYALRNEPWLFYTTYERMKSDLASVIHDICNFLNKSITAEQMQQMLKHLSLEEMKQNPKTNHHWEFDQIRSLNKRPYEPSEFVRKGKVDGYKDELSVEFIAAVDEWITRNLAKHNITLNELLLLEN